MGVEAKRLQDPGRGGPGLLRRPCAPQWIRGDERLRVSGQNRAFALAPAGEEGDFVGRHPP